MNTDLYELLEISRDASDTEIKSAHRRQILKYHPDKNPKNQEAAKRTAAINNAKEILLDPQRRAVYNRHGMQGLEKNPFQQTQENRNLPIKKCTQKVDIDAFYHGKLLKFKQTLRQKCETCTGTGCSDVTKKNTCTQCNGHGKITMQQRMGPMVQNMIANCPRCAAKGFQIESQFVCKKCQGVGAFLKETDVEYYIKKGSHYGFHLVPNKGDYIDESTTGHIGLELQPVVNSNYKFVRKGSNLYCDCQITLYEALLGFKLTMDHIDKDKKIFIVSRDPIQPGEIRKFEGLGMPLQNHAQEYGNLFVTFLVTLPYKITDEQRNKMLQCIPKGPEREAPQGEDYLSLQAMQKVGAGDQRGDEEQQEADEQQNNFHEPHMQFSHGPGVQCAQQ